MADPQLVLTQTRRARHAAAVWVIGITACLVAGGGVASFPVERHSRSVDAVVIEVTVTNSSGEPLEGAEITFMEDTGHSGTIDQLFQVSKMGGGRFIVSQREYIVTGRGTLWSELLGRPVLLTPSFYLEVRPQRGTTHTFSWLAMRQRVRPSSADPAITGSLVVVVGN